MIKNFWENLSINQKLAITAWVFLAIPIIFYVTIRFYPTYEAFYVSFMKWNLLGAKKYIGFKHYIRIFNDEDFGIRNTLESWMAGISNHKLNTRDKETFQNMSEGDVAKYKSTLQVTQLSKAGKDLRTYMFKGAWPSALSTINLDWSTASEIEEFTCTWVYDSWIVSAGSSDSNLAENNVINAPDTNTNAGII